MNDAQKVALVVDDSAIQRGLLSRGLSAAGYKVVIACDGQDGISKLESIKPDLILTDLLMPNMNGFDFLRSIQGRNLGCPIAVLTADIQETSKNRCQELGATHFFNKPVRVDSINLMLEAILKG